jgi:FdhD protein
MKTAEQSALPLGVEQATVTSVRVQSHAALPQMASRPAYTAAQRTDLLAQEVPVAFVFNGISHAVMMASPSDLPDFALGFALTEGLIDSPQELFDVEVVEQARGIELQLQVAAQCEWRLKQRRKTLSGKTGCGLCGAESLAQLHLPLPTAHQVAVTAAALQDAQAHLQDWQTVQQLTGATHAAAWANLAGQIIAVREDVGRHNALDKLIGHLVKHKTDPTQGFLLITSRASFEMIQKALVFGAGFLAAVSAPTAMAVRLAQQNKLALAGFVRHENAVMYSQPQQLHLKTEQASYGHS